LTLWEDFNILAHYRDMYCESPCVPDTLTGLDCIQFYPHREEFIQKVPLTQANLPFHQQLESLTFNGMALEWPLFVR
jgi:hypothetical protein